MFRFFIVSNNCGVFYKEYEDQENVIKFIQAIISKVEKEFINYPNPLIDPDYYSMITFLFENLRQAELCKKIHNHYIKTESDIDVFLDSICKLHKGHDRDITTYLVESKLLEDTHYREKYDDRYWD